jgi:hypothetical protein
MRRIPKEQIKSIDCFIEIGASQVRDATQRISIYSSRVLFVFGIKNLVTTSA